MQVHRLLLLLSFSLLAPKIAYTNPIETIYIHNSSLTDQTTSFLGHNQIITQSDIKKSGSTNVAAILKQYAQLQVRDDYGDGSRVTIGMRGFGDNASQNTLILLNGKRLNNPLDIAGVNLNQISVSQIERIEIYNGSGGVAWGENAVGGVINIITESQFSQKLLNVTIGSHDYLRQTIFISNPLASNLSGKFLLENTQTDNYRNHNRLENTLINGQLNWGIDNHNIQLTAQHSDESLELPGAIFQHDINENRKQSKNLTDFVSSKTSHLELTSKHLLFQQWLIQNDISYQTATIQGKLSVGDFTTPIEQKRKSYHLLTQATREMHADLNAITHYGFELNHSDYQFFSLFGTQSGKQTSASFFTRHTLNLTEKLMLQSGIRFISISTQFNDSFSFPDGERFTDQQWLGEIGITYQLSSYLDFYTRFDRNVRFPRLDEHIGQLFGITKPLETQTGQSYEIGANFLWDNLTSNINFFYLKLNDEIAYDGLLFANRNLDPTKRFGSTVSVDYAINDSLSVGGSYSHVNAEFTDGTAKGKQIPMHAKHRTNMSINWQIYSQLQWQLQWQHTSNKFASSDDLNQLSPVQSYDTINTTINYQHKNLALSFSVNNLFNTSYNNYAVKSYNPFPNAETAFYPAPKRQYTLSLQLEF